VSEATDLVVTGVAKDGMALKVRTALAALESGVTCVRIGRSDIVVDPAAGTRIRREAEVLAWR
jgi:acetylglutamate kinase